MRFRPCIDLRNGKVVQIVGNTLSDSTSSVRTNFESSVSPAVFADLYRKDGLEGGHVIMLGPGNEEAATQALKAYPQGLQVGGGITPSNCHFWLNRGAQKIIVTSYLFDFGELSFKKLDELAEVVRPQHLTLDLSCSRKGDDYVVVINRWQSVTSSVVSKEFLEKLAPYCSEFLIHATDIEGQQNGIDEDLIQRLARWSPLPVTYAGGIHSLADIKTIYKLGQGRVDFTVGSALDLFGGNKLSYRELALLDERTRTLDPAHPFQ